MTFLDDLYDQGRAAQTEVPQAVVDVLSRISRMSDADCRHALSWLCGYLGPEEMTTHLDAVAFWNGEDPVSVD